ncbi:hypothetical protein BS47DRAFT_1373451 [Hydnum rufescens UP504]|uniref:Serine protease n=1 Tax=Hydnum rufescens UP504 TaxID=1448309 RepID=A0A9P6DP89_9AGAM|nr:hypothetical protein BS47DRAFT_1373451 [Hydnum rufescens UP504]
MFSILLLALPLAIGAVPASTYPYVRGSDTEHAIANNYIVVFKSDTPLEVIEAHTSFIKAASFQSEHEGLNHLYLTTIKGYSGSFDDRTLGLIRSAPEVDYVEEDQTVWASEVQNGAPWGLARISHRKRLTFGTFRKYLFHDKGGEGVDAYVIDTGINVHHVSFEGRAKWGHTVPRNDVDEDGNGHGTHCAGTIASKDYGVAKAANVIAVKVLGSNGSGSMSDVIAGVDWAATAAFKKAEVARAEELRTGRKSAFKGSVANLSLGGGKAPSLDAAINAAVRGDACNYSPAAAEEALTVGATTLQDSRAYFSNVGKCVDVFAPGLNILSTWNSHNRSTNTISGTSMASPHVAGLLAYLLSIYPGPTFHPPTEIDLASTKPTLSSYIYSNPTFSLIASIVKYVAPTTVVPSNPAIHPRLLKKAVIKLSTVGIITDVGADSPNLLVFNNFTSEANIQSQAWWTAL